MPTIRVSVLRCQPQHSAGLKKLMAESIAVLEPGIRPMRGLIHFYAGEDETGNALINVSIWQTLADAKQLDTFQPMLDLGKVFDLSRVPALAQSPALQARCLVPLGAGLRSAKVAA